MIMSAMPSHNKQLKKKNQTDAAFEVEKCKKLYKKVQRMIKTLKFKQTKIS